MAILEAARQEDELPLTMVGLTQHITSAEEAIRWGQRCDALFVLWEPPHRRGLVLNTLPTLAHRIPVRGLPLPHPHPARGVCSRGELYQQLGVIYHTIHGTTLLSDQRYDQARLQFERVRRLEAQCREVHLLGDEPPPYKLS